MKRYLMITEQTPLIPPPNYCAVRDEHNAKTTCPNGNTILVLTSPSRKITKEESIAGDLPSSNFGDVIASCVGCFLNKRNGGPCIPVRFLKEPLEGILPAGGDRVITRGSLEILVNWI